MKDQSHKKLGTLIEAPPRWDGEVWLTHAYKHAPPAHGLPH